MGEWRKKEYDDEQVEALRQGRVKLSLTSMAEKTMIKFDELLDKGNERAVLQAQKQLVEAEKYANHQHEEVVCSWLVRMAESKAQVIAALNDLFNFQQKKADAFITTVVKKYGLETPAERIRRQRQEAGEDICEAFSKGELTEVELLRHQMMLMLRKQMMSEYASEAVNTSKQIVDISRRLDEIRERERREQEMDKFTAIEMMDSAILGTTAQMVVDFKESKYFTLCESSGVEVVEGELIDEEE